MAGNEGALALRLDFGETTTTAPRGTVMRRPALRLASGGAAVRGARRYAVLEHRRRQAQIKARRLLDATGD